MLLAPGPDDFNVALRAVIEERDSDRAMWSEWETSTAAFVERMQKHDEDMRLAHEFSRVRDARDQMSMARLVDAGLVPQAVNVAVDEDSDDEAGQL
jgi:hypothetical protein